MGYSNLRSMINLLDNVIYLPTNKIKKFDPKLLAFLTSIQRETYTNLKKHRKRQHQMIRYNTSRKSSISSFVL